MWAHLLIRLPLVLSIGLGVAVPSPGASAQTPGKADLVLVLKRQRVLELLRGGAILKSYQIALGLHPIGPKQRAGDGKTPEGGYVIDGRTTQTPYHLALHISYPDTLDRLRARAAHVSPGGEIYIHGMPRSYGHNDPGPAIKNWTDGCIAVGNIAIEEIWVAVDNGTPIEIEP